MPQAPLLRRLHQSQPQSFVPISELKQHHRRNTIACKEIFLHALHRYMQVLGWTEFNGSIILTGLIEVSVDKRLQEAPLTLPIRIRFRDHWQKLQPSITVAADYPEWLQRGADWHVYLDYQICFELRLRWKEHLHELLQHETPEHCADCAAQWILQGARLVLHVHYTCWRLDIDSWPEDIIPSWPHGEPANELYRAEKSIHSQKNSRISRQ